jgi:hypothetical protein
MRQALRGLVGLLAVGALAAGGSVALADDGGGRGGRDRDNSGPGDAGDRGAALAPTLFTMTPADGPPEGVAFDLRSGQFFVSRTGTGAIFSGKLDQAALQPFIAGGAKGSAPLATGLKVRKGLLYVAGASTGTISVFDIATKALVAQFATGGAFVNDLDLTDDGDVFATDSGKAFIYRVDASKVKTGARGSVASGDVEAINVAPEIDVDPDAFNLNGIVVREDDGEGDDDGDGVELIVVQSNTGKLFRIAFGGDRGDEDRNDRNASRRGDDDRNATRRDDDARGDDDRRGRARQAQAGTRRIVEIKGATVQGGDGLLIDRGRLLVVQGAPTNDIAVVKLRRDDTRASIESRVTNDSFPNGNADARLDNPLVGPSTVARARDLLLVVNANFGGAATATEFTVAGLPRNVVSHGGGGNGGGGGGGGGHRGRG